MDLPRALLMKSAESERVVNCMFAVCVGNLESENDD